MSTWARQDLVDWVQARIDEVSPLDQSATIPQLIIERELDESALQLCRKAKKQLIYPAGKSYTTQFCLVQKVSSVPYSVILPLKSTFLRFLRVKLANWNLPIDDVVSVDTNMYRHQYNQYQKATIGRPTAALIPFYLVDGATTYTQAIEVYPPPTSLAAFTGSAGAGESTIAASALARDANLQAIFNTAATTALVKEFLIVEKIAAEAMPDSLIDPLIWLTAGRCLTSLRDSANAKAAFDNYTFVLDQLNIGMKGEEVNTTTPTAKGGN